MNIDGFIEESILLSRRRSCLYDKLKIWLYGLLGNPHCYQIIIDEQFSITRLKRRNLIPQSVWLSLAIQMTQGDYTVFRVGYDYHYHSYHDHYHSYHYHSYHYHYGYHHCSAVSIVSIIVMSIIIANITTITIFIIIIVRIMFIFFIIHHDYHHYSSLFFLLSVFYHPYHS